MLIRPLPVITRFIDSLSDALQASKPNARLTTIQKTVLGAMIAGIIVTEKLCWAAFERRSLGKFKATRLCWIFYSAKIAWHSMLQASVCNILQHYGIRSGTLTFDDTGKKRSKRTTHISRAHKVMDKATGGYFNGQELVFMILVSDTVTFPVGFRFFEPDPALSQWKKKDRQLKRQGVAKQHRPRRPKPDHDCYPTMQTLALDMIREFVDAFPEVAVKGVLADALYGTGEFMDRACAMTGNSQVVSQLRSNQKVASRNSSAAVKDYFARQQGVETHLVVRGGQSRKVTVLAARLRVNSHDKRRFVVALKYEGEEEYRYLVASCMSWHHIDVVRFYTLRWLVEVFIQDWKAHGGWNRLSKQRGKEGSERGLILSLLCEHLLLLHPEQTVRLKNNQPGMPAGCLIERLNAEALVDTVREVVTSDNPKEALAELTGALENVLPIRDSGRHMAGRDLGKQEPTESLKVHAKKFEYLDAA